MTPQHRPRGLERVVQQRIDRSDLDARGERSRKIDQPANQPFDARDLTIQRLGGVDHLGAAGNRGALPREQLHGSLHSRQRIQHLVRQLGSQLADRRQLFALHQAPAMLGQRRVGLLQLLDQRADLIAQRLDATPGRELDPRSFGCGLDLDLELVDGLGDLARPQEPGEQARDRAGDAGSHQQMRQAAHLALGVRERALRVLARHAAELVEEVAQPLRAGVIAFQLAPRIVSPAGVVKRDCRFSGAVVGGVFSLDLVQQLARGRIADLGARGRQPRLESRAAGFELREPGTVPRQQVLGDEAFLVLERAHGRGVVDERHLLGDRDARHRGRVLQRRQPDRTHDTDAGGRPQ